MKSSFLDKAKNMIWFAILCIAACSTFETRNTPLPDITYPNTPTTSVNVKPIPLSLSGKIAFIGEGGDWDDYRILILQLDNGTVIDITPPDMPFIRNLSWAPDGRYIAFDALKNNITQIFKISDDGKQLVQLTFGENHAFQPSWSPDGKNILFVSSQQNMPDFNNSHGQHLYIMKSDGTNVRRFVVKSQSNNKSVGGYYRSDGLVAVYEPVTRYSVKNYVVNSSGVVQKQFPEFTTNGPIVWSPDGKSAIYTADRTTSDCPGFFIRSVGNLEVSCLNIEYAMAHQKNDKMIGADGASWSPDGNYVIFSSSTGGDTDIYIVKLDGTGLFQITNLSGNEGGAVWWSTP